MLGRDKKVSAMYRDVKEKAVNIMDEFIGFTHGTRVIILLHRAKDGGANKEYQRRLLALQVNNEGQFYDALVKCLVIKNTFDEGDYRVYSTANKRDLKKASRNLKEALLEMDYAAEDNWTSYYERLQSKWISALTKKSARVKDDEMVFKLDVDNEEGRDVMGEVLSFIEDNKVEEVMRYHTKNGWHVLVKPFDQSTWNVPNVEVQYDSLLLLDH